MNVAAIDPKLIARAAYRIKHGLKPVPMVSPETEKLPGHVIITNIGARR